VALPVNNLPNFAAVPLPPQPGVGGAAASQNVAGPDGSSFKDYLLKSLDQVNSMQQQANSAIESMATGGDVNPAEVLTAVQKADLAFRLTMQIRNKLVAAYQDIQNIRI
jgi:flagellar hook-basal body complex protein FliE